MKSRTLTPIIVLLLCLAGAAVLADAPTFLEQFDQAVSDLVSRAAQSVVQARFRLSSGFPRSGSFRALQAEMRQHGVRPGIGTEIPGIGFLSFDRMATAESDDLGSTGTGAVIDQQGHVLFYAGERRIPEPGDSVTIVGPDGTALEATTVASQRGSGMVLVHCPDLSLPPLPMGDSGSLRLGSLAIAVSRTGFHVRTYPSGSTGSVPGPSDRPEPPALAVSVGTVAAEPTGLGLLLNLAAGQRQGGALLLNSRGEWVGIVTATEVSPEFNIGSTITPLTTVGYPGYTIALPPRPVTEQGAGEPAPAPPPPSKSAGPLYQYTFHIIPATPAAFPTARALALEKIKPLLPAMLAGAPVHGWLGLSAREMTSQEAQERGLQPRQAYVVTEVVPNGPAAKAGIRPGGLIIRPEGDHLWQLLSLDEMLKGTEPGDVFHLTLDQDDSVCTLLLALDLTPEARQHVSAGYEVPRPNIPAHLSTVAPRE